jgi:hypothetical protein
LLKKEGKIEERGVKARNLASPEALSKIAMSTVLIVDRVIFLLLWVVD